MLFPATGDEMPVSLEIVKLIVFRNCELKGREDLRYLYLARGEKGKHCGEGCGVGDAEAKGGRRALTVNVGRNRSGRPYPRATGKCTPSPFDRVAMVGTTDTLIELYICNLYTEMVFYKICITYRCYLFRVKVNNKK